MFFKSLESSPHGFMASALMRHLDRESLKRIIKILRKRGEDCCDVVEMIT